MTGSGTIHIDRTRVTSREEGDALHLLVIPSGRHYQLDANAADLWRRIEGGCTQIDQLVADHAKAHSVSTEVAAFQVITFLDELRAAGFIDFALEKERDSAPLVDTELSHLRPRFVKRIGEAALDRVPIDAVVLDTPNLELHLREVRSVAERVAAKGVGSFNEIVALRTVNAEVTLSELHALANDPKSFKAAGIDVIGTISKPSPDLVLREAVGVFSPTGSLAAPSGSANRLIVIVIFTDDVIIVIVIDDGPGPGAGKSRSACKTMCV